MKARTKESRPTFAESLKEKLEVSLAEEVLEGVAEELGRIKAQDSERGGGNRRELGIEGQLSREALGMYLLKTVHTTRVRLGGPEGRGGEREVSERSLRGIYFSKG